MKFTLKLLIPLCLILAISVGTQAGPRVGQDAATKSAEPAKPESVPATQEPAADPNAAAAEKSLADLLIEWSDMDKRLRESETAARADDATDAAKTAYKDLVDQAYQMIDKIQTAAVGAIEKDPKDETAAKTLVGIMVNGSLKADGDAQVLALADTLINAGLPADLFSPALISPRLTPFAKDLFEEILIRYKEHQADDLPRVKFTTTKGDIVLELFENEAPNTVANFVSLVESKFYDGLKFHRVIDGFMAQGGDPLGDGNGGPGYKIKCECYAKSFRKHFSGTLSMAHAGRDTGGSQFFITFKATSHLDGRHTAFGRVISGMDVLEQLTRTYTDAGPIPGVEPDKIVTAEVVRERMHEYKPIKVGDQPAAVNEAAK